MADREALKWALRRALSGPEPRPGSEEARILAAFQRVGREHWRDAVRLWLGPDRVGQTEIAARYDITERTVRNWIAAEIEAVFRALQENW